MSTRDKILNIAEDMFLTLGYDNVSVRDITKKAGANVASINYHFNCKENLYREVFKRKLSAHCGKMITEIDNQLKPLPRPSLEDSIRAIVSVFLRDFLASSDSEKIITIISNEMSEDGIARDLFLEEAVFPIQRKIRETIMDASPDIPQEKIALYISSIIGQVFHFVRAKSIIQHTTGRKYDKEFLQTIIDHITTFSVNGIRG